MDLIKLEKKKRLQGIIIGLIAPVFLLFVISCFAYFKVIFERPYLTDDVTKLTVGATSLFGVFWIYITSEFFFHAFFSLAINMGLVFYLSNKNKNSMAKGIIVPTAIYALTLVAIRLI